MLSGNDISGLKTFGRKAALDETQIALRKELAKYTAEIFTQVGEELYEVAHMNRSDQDIPMRYGTDEINAVSLLFRIAGQLASATSNLILDGQHYAAAALVRQIVEIEYLAWAFQSRDGDAERWLRSTADERQNFFKPAKLRQAANGKFRGKDYGYHCELGGHPVPGALIFFPQNMVASQLLLSDLLGHTGRIWDHLLDWSAGAKWALPIYSRREAMFLHYSEWQKADELTLLPPPP